MALLQAGVYEYNNIWIFYITLNQKSLFINIFNPLTPNEL
jgi:hypothetical protein